MAAKGPEAEDSGTEDEAVGSALQRKTGSFCCLPLCSSEYGKDTSISFHEFPTEKERQSAWLHAIRRDVGKNFAVKPKITKVCGLHFKESDYVAVSARALQRREKEGKGGTPRRRLLPNAVPSVFSFSTSTSTAVPRKPPAKRRCPQPSSSSSSSSSKDEEMSGDEEVVDAATELQSLRQKFAEVNLQNEQLEMEVKSVKSHLTASEARCSQLNHEKDELTEKLEKAEASLSSHIFDIRRFSEKAHMVKMYTGFTSFDMYMTCFRFLEQDAAEMRAWRGSRTKLEGDRMGRKSGRKHKLSLEMQFFFRLCSNASSAHSG